MRSPWRTATAIAVAALIAIVLLLPAETGATGPVGQQTGYIQISSDPPGAEVFVNQARMNGVTPLTLRVPVLETQDVVVNLYGYEAERQTVTLQPNETLPLMFDLQPLPGAGQLGAETPGAARSPTAPPGEPTEVQEAWEEETPLTASAALIALAGSGLLAARRRR